MMRDRATPMQVTTLNFDLNYYNVTGPAFIYWPIPPKSIGMARLFFSRLLYNEEIELKIKI